MAPNPNAKPSVQTGTVIEQPGGAREPRVEIARLAALHDEARETALLANLLGRVPYVIAALAISAGLAVTMNYGAMPAPEAVTWLVLMLIGIGAMARAYAQAIEMPFERAGLRNFAADLNAITVYSGFAWGAGAYLALSPATTLPELTLFTAGAAALIGVIFRSRNIALGFLAPVTALGAFAAVLRPLPDGPLAAAFVLIACAVAAAAIFGIERLFTPAQTLPPLADLSHA